jgi:Tfp pilus assembly protein PilV
MVRARAGDERGQSLVEALVAMLAFAIVATGIVGMLVSSTSITTLAKQRTVAEQGVSNQIELIRAMDYNSIGTTSGNPAGSLQASVSFKGVNNEDLGVPATLTTRVTFASADVPGSALTGADDKKVTVTISRNSDSKVLASAVTYIAPKLQASQTTATVQATVTDIGNNQSQSGTVLQNVRVTLTPPAGLSPAVPAGPESDVTDASGTVSFGALTPTTGSQVYTLGIASADMPSLYYAQSVPAFDLSPTEILPQSIQVYQPVTLNVALVKPDGTPWVGTANVTVTAGSGGTTYQFNNVSFTAAGTPKVITTQGSSGSPLLPNIDYFVTVQATGYGTVTDDSLVPASGSYPATIASDLAYTFTETMAPLVLGTLDVTATRINSTTHNAFACRNGATITVTDGGGATVAQGTTSTSSPYDVRLQVPANATYTVQATNGSGSRSGSSSATPAPDPTVTPVAVALSGSSTTSTNC